MKNPDTHAPAPRAVEVKKLEWRDRSSEGEYAIRWDTRGSIFTYVAKAVRLNDMILCNGRYHANIEAAKAAAQSDYEQRIRSALVDVPVDPAALIEREVLAELEKHKTATGTVCSPLFKSAFGDKVALYTVPPLPHREGENST